MINLHKSYLDELGLEFETKGSAVRRINDCTMQPGPKSGVLTAQPLKYLDSAS